MFENLTPLNAAELSIYLNRRAVYNADPQKVHFRNKRVLGAFILMDQLVRVSGVRIGDLQFENCLFESEVKLGAYQSAGHVIFTNCLFSARVSFESTQNITLEGHIEFLDDFTTNVGHSRQLENIIVRKNLTVLSSDALSRKWLIQNINVNQPPQEGATRLHFTSGSIDIVNVVLGSIEIDAHNQIPVTIADSSFRSLKINNRISTVVVIDSCKIEKLKLKEIEGNEGIIQFSGSTFGELVISGSQFKKVDLQGLTINKLIFREIIERDRYITILECQVEQLSFEGLYNNGILSFRAVSIVANGMLFMANSTLGKTDFIVCQFDLAEFIFLNSKVTDIFVAETDFPTTMSNKRGDGFAQAQLAFGQISTAFQKQGDTVRALEYQSREIEAHYQSLRFYDKEKHSISFTKFSLGLNKLSNNFGRSWQKGLVFSIAAGIIFFYAVVVSSKDYTFGFPITFNKMLFQAFLKFMNPLRFFDSELLFRLPDGKPLITLQSASYFWDYLGRLFVAYGFYQTIQAFRKFGRK